MSGKIFKPVSTGNGNGNLSFLKFKDLADSNTTGIVLEGIYEGTKANPLDEERLDYMVRKEDGTLVIVNKTASLAKQMEAVEIGSAIQIEYRGMKQIKSGAKKGKFSHDIVVLVEQSN